MRRQPSLHTALVLLVCVVLSACGTTGKTSRFALTLEPRQNSQVVSEIRVASMAMEEPTTQLITVNVLPWGKFGSDDLQNIEQSLLGTIALNLPATLQSTESRLDIHLVVRRYVVSVSNTGGAILACIAWAATNSEGVLIFEEQFYASKKVYVVGTIGLLKDSVHKAIVRRIAATSLALASVSSTASPRPTFDDTFTSLEEAASHLPRTMVSLGNPSIMAFPYPGVAAVGLFTPSGVTTVKWEMSKPAENFDWHGYLEKLHSRP